MMENSSDCNFPLRMLECFSLSLCVLSGKLVFYIGYKASALIAEITCVNQDSCRVLKDSPLGLVKVFLYD